METNNTKTPQIKSTEIDHNSPDWLRSFKGCEHYTDQEANEILETLNTLATILLECASEKIYHIDNQQFVYLNQQKQQNKAA